MLRHFWANSPGSSRPASATSRHEPKMLITTGSGDWRMSSNIARTPLRSSRAGSPARPGSSYHRGEPTSTGTALPVKKFSCATASTSGSLRHSGRGKSIITARSSKRPCQARAYTAARSQWSSGSLCGRNRSVAWITCTGRCSLAADGSPPPTCRAHTTRPMVNKTAAACLAVSMVGPPKGCQVLGGIFFWGWGILSAPPAQASCRRR